MQLMRYRNQASVARGQCGSLPEIQERGAAVNLTRPGDIGPTFFSTFLNVAFQLPD